ncbi:MAG TPA: SNF2-related protein, partial [Hyphomicrobiaceae bacterium]|nr:SNF2-related protein [Hyphomicrobiaceae bacterium]
MTAIDVDLAEPWRPQGDGGDEPSLTLTPVLTPHGALVLRPSDDGVPLPRGLGAQLQAAFARGPGHGLLALGADHVGAALPPVLSYWREPGVRYVTALCALPGLGDGAPSATKPAVPPPADDALERMAAGAPPMPGAEYLTAAVLADMWRRIDAAFEAEQTEAGLSAQDFLKARNPAWNLVGRVHFNLAENRKDEAAPFAFMATYTTGLSATGKAQHLPLGRALKEYAGARNRQRLLSLLTPVQRAAEACAWLKGMVDAGEIYHPLRWTPSQAMQLLKDVPALEGAGVVVRMPASWRMNRPARPQVKATVGGKAPSELGLDALLDFQMEVTLDGETLTKAEVKRLLAQSEGLALVRGKWVEVDRDRLARTLETFEATERRATAEGLTFGEAMRMLAGAGVEGDGGIAGSAAAAWSQTVAGPWLAQTLAGLRRPEGLARIDPGATLQATLRPYQRAGVQWLYLLARLRLGACLADDMGLGKTIQVLSLLLVLKQEAETNGKGGGKPSLLMAPASLLANWSAEIARFAPDLKAVVAHPSEMAPEQLKAATADHIGEADLVITSYGSLARVPWLAATPWRLVILDEAQAIKNPAARQTRAVKALKADTRIALTGTPIENRLGDLWSIFDFVNPGLLGSAKQFSGFVKRLAERPESPYAPLRDLVRPYILRRLKTDRSIIADLPDKTEVKAFCPLSRKQAALYTQAVDDLGRQLETADGMARR